MLFTKEYGTGAFEAPVPPPSKKKILGPPVHTAHRAQRKESQ